jgi:hypothetical protein
MVQFYGADDQLLASNVGRYLFEGYKIGDGMLVIGVPAHNQAISNKLNALGVDVDTLTGAGRLRFLDAEEMLSKFMAGGQPYWRRFESAMETPMEEIRAAVGHGGLRAYGEMVGVLWEAGQQSAAVRVEQFWNKLLTRCSASLFCGYAIDVFAEGFEAEAIDALLCAHTHLVPTASNGGLKSAVRRAVDSVLGPDARESRPMRENKSCWPAVPEGEATLLWIRKNLPDRADEILARAREFYCPSTLNAVVS